jgi:hypothetical protein
VTTLPNQLINGWHPDILFSNVRLRLAATAEFWRPPLTMNKAFNSKTEDGGLAKDVYISIY